MFTKKIQSSRANGNINPIIYHNDSNGYNTDRFPKQQDSRQINSNFNQRKTFTSGQFTQFKKIQPQKNTELVIRQCDPSQLNMRKNIGRQSEDLAPNYQFGSSKKQMISIGSRKKYDSNMKQPMVQIHFSDRENSQSRRSSQFQHNSSQVQVLTEELLKLNDYVKDNFSRFNFQIYQSTLESKKAAKIAQSANVTMVKVVAAVNQNLNNQKNQIIGIRNLQNQSHNQIQSLKNSFFDFVKEQEQKMQNMVLDGSMKRSKHFDQFGVDLKSSSQCLGGIGASMSVNFGGQNLNLKLYNQLSIQLETFKSQLQDCKQKIQKFSVQRRFQNETLLKQQKPDNNNNNNNNVMSVKLQLCEIEKIISQKLIDFKKNLNLNQKFTQIQTKLHYLSIQKHNQESNIKGMNEQFNRVLNTVIIPRQKAIEQKVKICEQSIKKINEKEQISIKNLIQPQVKAHIQKQLEKTKILKVRSQNKKEEQTLALMNYQSQSQNQSQNSSQIYMLDQNNYLVDSRGYYLVENNTQQSGIECKKKIKIQEDLLYLLEVNGMQITTIP